MGQGAGYSPAEQSFQTGFHQKGASACWFPRHSGQLFPGVRMRTFPLGKYQVSPVHPGGPRESGERQAVWGRGSPFSLVPPQAPPLHSPHALHPQPSSTFCKAAFFTTLSWGWLPQAKPPAWRRTQGLIPPWPGQAPAPGRPILPGRHRAPARPRAPFLDPSCLAPWR